MKIKQIQINHPELGQIVINSEVEKEINDKIGTITEDYSKYPMYYHANIFKNEDGTFKIDNLSIITPKSLKVGIKKTNSGFINFITVITNNPVGKDIVVYPSGVLTISYI